MEKIKENMYDRINKDINSLIYAYLSGAYLVLSAHYVEFMVLNCIKLV